MTTKSVHLIAAARPNFMKVAPLYHAIAATDWAEPLLVHTGQHYDTNMSDAILRDLRLPEPAYNLGVGSGTHAEQTGRVMIEYERLCLSDRPDMVIVVGDVNPTAACALVCAKLLIPVAHLEAGLRSGDRRMPEEINRLVTDAISDLLWTPSQDANDNLLAEGVDAGKIELVGNIMIDSFEMLREKIASASVREELGLDAGDYALVTLHRPSNVDEEKSMKPIVEALIRAAANLPVVFVAHPRTLKALKAFGLDRLIGGAPGLKLVEPLPYVRFMSLLTGARLVITDSGGLQEETTYLGIPCLTLRENTERPITIHAGTNKLVEAETLGESLSKAMSGEWSRGSTVPLWDGKTAARVVDSIQRWLCVD